DLVRLRVLHHLYLDALADGILTGEIFSRECFVNDDCLAICGRLLRSEVAPADKGDVQRVEVVLVNDAHVCRRLVAVRRLWLTFHEEGSARAQSSVERKIISKRD